MLSPMDVRQLTRWLKHLRLLTPENPGYQSPPEGDDAQLELHAMLSGFSDRITKRNVGREVNHIWALCSTAQWEELRYLAERHYVPWPEIQYTDEVDRLLSGLKAEYPETPDESDIAL